MKKVQKTYRLDKVGLLLTKGILKPKEQKTNVLFLAPVSYSGSGPKSSLDYYEKTFLYINKTNHK